MNVLHSSSLLFIEFKEHSLHLLDGSRAVEWRVGRDEAGRLSGETKEELRRNLSSYAGRRAVCSIPARGVSLRLMTVPEGTAQETARMLSLQIEAQFPVSPAELAWGYVRSDRAAGKPGMQQLLVAAVKRELLEMYQELLSSAGIEGSFTIAALARCATAANPPRTFGFLEADQPRSELIAFDEAGQPQLRSLILRELPAAQFGEKLFIAGPAAAQAASALALNGAAELVNAGPGSTANAGLQRRRGDPPLVLGIEEDAAEPKGAVAQWKWPAIAAVLLFAFFGLRLIEPALRKPRLEQRLRQIQQRRDALPAIERELALLQYMKTNQAPFLEAISTLADAAPRGTRFESISFPRRGELSVRGTLGNPQAGAAEFRSKLIESGLFAKVVLDEQTPDQQGQKLTFRLSAQLNAEAPRKAVLTATNAPARKETNHGKAL